MIQPLIADTSIWIDFFNDKKSKGVDTLSQYLEEDYSVFLTPTIIQEILQGIRLDSDFVKVKEYLLCFDILEIDQKEAAIGAAELYRSLRKSGATIRKSNDCLIAFYAIYFKIPILHNDNDFKLISKHSKLKLL